MLIDDKYKLYELLDASLFFSTNSSAWESSQPFPIRRCSISAALFVFENLLPTTLWVFHSFIHSFILHLHVLMIFLLLLMESGNDRFPFQRFCACTYKRGCLSASLKYMQMKFLHAFRCCLHVMWLRLDCCTAECFCWCLASAAALC